MANEIATVPVNSFLALQDGGDIAEAMQANLGGGALRLNDLTRVPIPTGGETQWIIPSLVENEVVDAIEGVLVFKADHGVLWPSDDPIPGTLPVLVTHDFITARLTSGEVPAHLQAGIDAATDEAGVIHWTKLPFAQWGTGKKGVGKQVKEQRVLFILRRNDPLPLIIIVQPGSLRNWDCFIVSLTKCGIPYYRAVVKLTLEQTLSKLGTKYAAVSPEIVGVVSKEEAVEIRRRYTVPFAKLMEDSAGVG